jgi:hypothetical protein
MGTAKVKKFTDTKTGKVVSKGTKQKPTLLEPNPNGYPWFAFDVRRWLNSDSVTRMNDSQRGVYVQILATLWLNNTPLPCDPWMLSRKIGCRFENAKKFMKSCSHLVVIVEPTCSEHVVGVEPTCRQCVADLESPRSRFVVPQLLQIADFTEDTGFGLGPHNNTLHNNTGENSTLTLLNEGDDDEVS